MGGKINLKTGKIDYISLDGTAAVVCGGVRFFTFVPAVEHITAMLCVCVEHEISRTARTRQHRRVESLEILSKLPPVEVYLRGRSANTQWAPRPDVTENHFGRCREDEKNKNSLKKKYLSRQIWERNEWKEIVGKVRFVLTVSFLPLPCATTTRHVGLCPRKAMKRHIILRRQRNKVDCIRPRDVDDPLTRYKTHVWQQ